MPSRILCALALGCGGGGRDSSHDTPTDEIASLACASAIIDLPGGRIDVAGASVVFAEGSVVAPSELEVCIADNTLSGHHSPVVTLRPDGFNFSSAVELSIAHSGDEETTWLFAPYWDGLPVRALQSSRPEPGMVRASVYRTGEVWAATDPRASVDWIESDNSVAEVLFLVDSTTDNADNLVDFAGQAPAIWQALLANGLDFQAGVVTMDAMDPAGPGRLRGVAGARWVQSDTIGGDDLLGELLAAPPPTSDVRQGFGALAAALSAVGPGDANEGFVRQGSSMAVVVFSNGDDETVGAPLTVSELAMWLGAGTGVHAIVHPPGHPDAGNVFRTLSEETGGDTLDIGEGVGSWTSFVVDRVATLGVGQGGVVLPTAAVPDSVEAWWVPTTREPVRLGARDFQYIPMSQSVLVDVQDFDPNEIIILYTPAG